MQFSKGSIRICVDDIDETKKSISGSLCGICVEKSIKFQDYMDMVLKIDAVLDDIGQPQASRGNRRFDDSKGNITPTHTIPYKARPEVFHSSDEIREEYGRIKTYDVLFQSRQFNTWQGIIFDVDGHKIGEFKSDLEFTMMILKAGRRYMQECMAQ